jgi:flagellar protein FliS
MSGLNRYVVVQNNTASKERLMVMLFETALRHIRAAIRLLDGKQRREAMILLDKASQIVAYLHGTLNPEAAPKLSATLKELYVFTAARLTRAIATGSSKDAREAERAFAPIAEGFSQAVAALTQQPAVAASKR